MGNKLKASSKSHGGLVVDDKNIIYSELEALARQQEQLLKEMEDYEDFEEPNNEDLANRLKNLKFEVKDLSESVDEVITESDSKSKKRRKKNKKKASPPLIDEIEDLVLINKVADCIKEAEENDDIDKNERDR